jgi:hypothetical protein
MDRCTALGLATVLVLAGCSGLGTGGQQPTAVTPVPAGEIDQSQVKLTGGVVDAQSTVWAHSEAALSTNYTVRVTQRTAWLNGTGLREMRRYREVARGGTNYRGYVRFDTAVPALQEFGTTAYWTNGTAVATRFNNPLRPVQSRIWTTNSSGPVDSPSNSPRLRYLLQATGPTVAEDDDEAVTLAGSQPTPQRLEMPPNLEEPRNLTTQFRVRGDGLIHRWRVAYNATFGGETVRVVRTGRIVDTGETAVRRPAWVDNATGAGEGNQSAVRAVVLDESMSRERTADAPGAIRSDGLAVEAAAPAVRRAG